MLLLHAIVNVQRLIFALLDDFAISRSEGRWIWR